MMSLLLATGTGQAAPSAPDYSKDSTWLCLPGRADTCSTPLATTALNPTATLGRSEHGRQGSTHRLLLRLSDGVA